MKRFLIAILLSIFLVTTSCSANTAHSDNINPGTTETPGGNEENTPSTNPEEGNGGSSTPGEDTPENPGTEEEDKPSDPGVSTEGTDYTALADSFISLYVGENIINVFAPRSLEPGVQATLGKNDGLLWKEDDGTDRIILYSGGDSRNDYEYQSGAYLTWTGSLEAELGEAYTRWEFDNLRISVYGIEEIGSPYVCKPLSGIVGNNNSSEYGGIYTESFTAGGLPVSAKEMNTLFMLPYIVTAIGAYSWNEALDGENVTIPYEDQYGEKFIIADVSYNAAKDTYTLTGGSFIIGDEKMFFEAVLEKTSIYPEGYIPAKFSLGDTENNLYSIDILEMYKTSYIGEAFIQYVVPDYHPPVIIE